MDDTVVVCLFRHGLTEENKRRCYLGWMDSPLCSDGIKEMMGYVNMNIHLDLLFSSDLKRTIQTASLLFSNREVEKIFELREMNFGDFEGKSYEQLKKDPVYLNWIRNPFIEKPPNGETFSQFTKRVDSGWNKILERMDKNAKKIAIITHGGVIRYLLTKFSLENKGFWDWEIPHGKGYKLIWNHSKDFRRGLRCTSLQVVPLMEKENGY